MINPGSVNSGLCEYCGGPYGAHYDTCRMVKQSTADPGISPAQLREFGVDLERIVGLNSAEIDALERDRDALREKVEALEKQSARDVAVIYGLAAEFNANLSARLDAALKRIDELEQRCTALEGAVKYAHQRIGGGS